MPEIITDQEILFKKSEPANDLEVGDIVQQLSISIPSHALGLAAPQIGIRKRVFLANLFIGGASNLYAFINPKITWTSPDKVPSEESCLSLPDIYRCVERHSQVSITCDKLINVTTGDLEVEPAPIRLKDRDSTVVQHENDHLNGVLLVSHANVMTQEERRRHKEIERNKRIEKARSEKTTKTMEQLQKAALKKPQKLSAKNEAKKKREAKKAKRQHRTAERQEKIRVEIQEKYAAEQKGLFSDDAPLTSKAIDKPEQD